MQYIKDHLYFNYFPNIVHYESINGVQRNRPEIVCLCGSTKFKEAFERSIIDLGVLGRIVLSTVGYNHADNMQYTKAVKERLDKLHKEKIKLADVIVVLNVDNYIGESTKSEIEYAKSLNKNILYLEEPDEVDDYAITNPKLEYDPYIKNTPLPPSLRYQHEGIYFINWYNSIVTVIPAYLKKILNKVSIIKNKE